MLFSRKGNENKNEINQQEVNIKIYLGRFAEIM
jgi:hypothetical protein